MYIFGFLRSTSVSGKTSRFLLFSALLFLPCLTASVAQVQNRNASFMVGSSADALWRIMEGSPYAQNGDRGLIVYMISYSSCGNCIVFLRDFWEARRSSMRLREVFAPVNQPQFLNEAADIALTRDPKSAEGYYKRSKIAPAVESSPERQAALEKVKQFNGKIHGVFNQIGQHVDGYPTFVLRETEPNGQDRVVIVSGWGPDFAKDLDLWIKKAAQ